MRTNHDRRLALIRLLLKDTAEIGQHGAARRESSCRIVAANAVGAK